MISMRTTCKCIMCMCVCMCNGHMRAHTYVDMCIVYNARFVRVVLAQGPC